MADVKISGLPASTLPLGGTEVLPLVQGGVTKKVASDDLTVKNVRSNATTGILQIAGPGVGTTRVMTTPNANFTAARTDAAQSFTGVQTWNDGGSLGDGKDIDMSLGVAASSKIGRLDRAYIEINRADFDGNVNIWTTTNGSAGLAKRLEVFHTGDVSVSTGNLVIGTSGKGIDFSINPAAAGATSELLNDYETGTWTPGYAFATLGDAAFTYTGGRLGTYTKVGNLVSCFFYLDNVTVVKGTASGDLLVTGLPFTIAGNTNYSGGVVVLTNSYPVAPQSFIAFTGTTTTGLRTTGGAAGITAADFAASNTVFLRGVIQYLVS
jgi:hypothetical protein